MLAKNRPVQLALAVITLAVQVIYILIEMNALGVDHPPLEKPKACAGGFGSARE
jgi:hypothetical protein